MNDILKRNLLTRIRYKLANNETLDTGLALIFTALILDGFLYTLKHNGKYPNWSE